MKAIVRRFLTIDYVCSRCGWSVRVRTQAPPKHALHYAQGIGPEQCFQCRQRESTNNCLCCKSNKQLTNSEANDQVDAPSGATAERR